jgi:hypothetical protein
LRKISQTTPKSIACKQPQKFKKPFEFEPLATPAKKHRKNGWLNSFF